MASSSADSKVSEENDSKEESSSSKPAQASSSSGHEEGRLEVLFRYLAEKLGLTDIDDTDSEKVDEKTVVLKDVSIDGVIEYIKEGKCKNIITMAGAGISTSAGIPDFRSPVSGLYHNLEKYRLPYPHAIFEIKFFQQNPQPFFTLAKELYPGSFKPTVCHYFIRLLQEKGLLLRHYTQNIDTLERVAGLPEEKLVEAHGTFHTSHCLKCKKEYSLDWMKEHIFADSVPTCVECNGIVKPDIVFFGENLPDHFHACLSDDFPRCDLLIILGSSLAVQPFASLIDHVPKTCPRLLLNRERVGLRDRIMTQLGLGAGLSLDSPMNTRDVAWLGDCDAGCLMLADKLGWADELNSLVEEEHKRIDKEKEEADKKEALKKEALKKEALKKEALKKEAPKEEADKKSEQAAESRSPAADQAETKK